MAKFEIPITSDVIKRFQPADQHSDVPLIIDHIGADLGLRLHKKPLKPADILPPNQLDQKVAAQIRTRLEELKQMLPPEPLASRQAWVNAYSSWSNFLGSVEVRNNWS